MGEGRKPVQVEAFVPKRAVEAFDEAVLGRLPRLDVVKPHAAAANIAVEMPESEVASSHYRILFLAALVLFMFTFVVNTAAELIRQRLREKYSSL